MSGRNAALVGTLALIGLLSYLTISVAARDGVTLVVVVSVVILVLFGVGALGALTTPPDE